MASIEHEGSPPSDSSSVPWEAVPVPDDYKVELPEEADEEDVHILEVSWNGEIKVIAQIEPVFGGEFTIDKIGRPAFWGEDVRSPAEQQREYEMGLEGIVANLRSKGATGIEINEQRGIAAAAAGNLRMAGWSRKWRSEEYWASGESLNLGDVVEAGHKVSLRFEKTSAPDADLGKVAAGGALRSVTELPVAE